MTTTHAISSNLLDELQSALTHGTVARRVETLRRVTDLFLNAANDYSDEQIEVFDDVFECLLRHIETSAKILLSKRLAPIAKAPPQTVRSLAFDDLIEVAAPVLSQSARLTDEMLIENVRSKSQAHMLAITRRPTLSGAVTEILVERGNNEVVRHTAANPGAEFSEKGYSSLLARAEQNEDIAVCFGLRPSIPRPHYLKLIARASASVRARLEAAHPQMAGDISAAVNEATRMARSAPATITEATRMARGLVQSLYDDGRLDDHEVTKFAAAGKFDETNAALACMAKVPVGMAENMMIKSRTEGLLILAKVSGLSWSTVQTVISMRASVTGESSGDMEENRLTYERLRPSTAQQVLRFHKMQETAPPPAA